MKRRARRGEEIGEEAGELLVDDVKTSKLPSLSRRALLTMTQIRILSLTSFAANRQKSSADLRLLLTVLAFYIIPAKWRN